MKLHKKIKLHPKVHHHIKKHHKKYLFGISLGGIGFLAIKIFVLSTGIFGLFTIKDGAYAASCSDWNGWTQMDCEDTYMNGGLNCERNDMDMTCNELGGGGSYCSSTYPDPRMDIDCDNDSLCQWNRGNSSCEDIGGGGEPITQCYQYEEQNACNENTSSLPFSCYWDSSSCNEITQCYDYEYLNDNGSSCNEDENNRGCFWNGSSCIDNAPTCNDYGTNENQCTNDNNCQWNGSSCEDKPVPIELCTDYQVELDCINNTSSIPSDCYWSNGYCNEIYQCSNYNNFGSESESKCESADNSIDGGGCLWNGDSCIATMSASCYDYNYNAHFDLCHSPDCSLVNGNICEPLVEGCMVEYATNYNPNANEDRGGCNYEYLILPSDSNYIDDALNNGGYTTSNGDFEGSGAISLERTNTMPADINLKNQNIKLTLPSGLTFKKNAGTTDYTGSIIPPKPQTNRTIDGKTSIAVIKVGSETESLQLENGDATLRIPATDKNPGDAVAVYHSTDEINWTKKEVVVVDAEGYATFNTDHFSYFAILEEIGSFFIENNALSIYTREVNLNISAPGAQNMRFSNDGSNWSGWIPYAETYSWTLTEGYEQKTVYAQFDTDGNTGTIEADTFDSIHYLSPDQNLGNISLTITGGVTECVYGTSLDMNAQDVKIGIPYTFSGSFPSAWYCQDYQGIDGGWTLTIQTTDLTNEKGNVISGSNLLISHDPVVVQGDLACTGNNGTPTQFYSAPYEIFEKISESKKICKVSADNVSLLVNVPANQAPGSYSGTLTLTMNGF
ncbi:MAG: hypothetical protein PHR61_00665 [Candidatus Absconditabacteria bacterium]|nr:hypothetical protein [Candidatus Absconditabacteria bacterium]